MMLRKAMSFAAALVLGAAVLPAGFAEAGTTADSKRVVVYYQTQYLNGAYVSPKALTDNTTGVTNVLVGAIHLDPDVVHLNDDPPEAPKFTQMWADLHAMQAAGVKVSAFVGGAAQGSFQRLDTEFDKYYPRLKNLVTTYGLDGLDLDVEETMSQAGINRLIDQLTTDFGTGFIITLAPVATALSGGGNLSGFNYETLERDRGAKIDWYNAQFYCGWGSMANTTGYDNIINRGVFTPSKVVAGVVTNSANCGGYVALPTLKNTLAALVAKYPTFGGVDGWEYFNSDPGGTAAPWQWAREMTAAMSGGSGGPANLALNKPATGSAACTSTEGPAKAVNGSVSGGNADKFCSLASSKWLQVDLGSSRGLGSVEVSHAAAGGESASYNTRGFTVQTSADGSTWTTRATVTSNTAAVTTHAVAGVSARYVRLNITGPTQGSDPAARIYELKVFA
ncbi:discoidin domain-containing protein [Kribbella catacumbae]|uniref:galactose-binding domain-containing protein n=1 Tax=Kribbella catacumbae TaxID=460086 RepID=UPI0003A10165|nr:discoidin domain-containing protein [Kribbella catacumbae]